MLEVIIKLLKNKIVILSAIVLLILLGILIIGTSERPTYDDRDRIHRGFVANGAAYAITNNEKYPVLKSFGSTPENIDLPGGYDALWSKSRNQLYYSDGRKLYSWDLNSGSREVVWKYTGKIYLKHFLSAEYITDDYLVVRAARGVSGFGFSYSFYMVDLNTGEVSELMGEEAGGVRIIADDSEHLYYTPGHSYIGKFNISTREYETICTLTGGGSISEGAVIASQLYFIYNSDTLCRIPASGGEAERLDLRPVDFELPEVMHSFAWDGEIFVILFASTGEKQTNLVAVLNPDTLELEKVEGQPEEVFEAKKILLDDGDYYIFSAFNLYKEK